jgi:hypothetical protein
MYSFVCGSRRRAKGPSSRSGCSRWAESRQLRAGWGWRDAINWRIEANIGRGMVKEKREGARKRRARARTRGSRKPRMGEDKVSKGSGGAQSEFNTQERLRCHRRVRGQLPCE